MRVREINAVRRDELTRRMTAVVLRRAYDRQVRRVRACHGSGGGCVGQPYEAVGFA
jgi:hypothetical protein